MMTIRSLQKIGVTCATFVAFVGGSIVMTGCKTAALIGVIAGAGTVVAIVVVAKYKANEQQKAAAAQRARAATMSLAAQAPIATRPPKTQAAAKRLAKTANPEATAVVVEKPKPEKPGVAAIPARHVPTADEMEEAITHKIPAYLAVPVPRQQIAAEEKGEATYMLWDTHRQQLVTDDVYVLKHDVRAGVTVKLNGVKAHVASAE